MRKIRVIIIGIVIIAIAVSGLVIWRVSRNKPMEKPIVNQETKNPTKNTNIEIKKTSESGEPWPKPIGLAEGKKYIGKEIIHAKWGKGPGEFGLQNVEGPYQDGPSRLAIRNNIIYLFDFYNHRILKYNLDGYYIGAVDLEKGINIPPSLRNTDYPGICSLFEKDKKQTYKKKGNYRAEIYKSFPPNKCIMLTISSGVAIDKEGDIFLTGRNYASRDLTILEYSPNGKFVSKFFDSDDLNEADKGKLKDRNASRQISNPIIDESDNLYLNAVSCSGMSGMKKEEILKNCKGPVIKISKNKDVKIIDWTDLDDKIKIFLAPIYIPDLALAHIDQKLKKLIECSRHELLSPFSIKVGKVMPKIALDKDGNIYEIVICDSDYQWKEGTMVIEWRLVKWRLVR